VQPPERLARRPVVAGGVAHRPQQGRQQRRRQPISGRGGQVGHLGGVANEAAEIVRGELTGPERLLPQRGESLATAGEVEVGEVAWRQRCPPRRRNRRADGGSVQER
jgi:hypothetical protein